MKLELKIKRPGGTVIHMADKTEIKFTPNERGDHVAEVTDSAHIKRLLSIPGYDLYDPDAEPVKEPVDPIQTAPAPTPDNDPEPGDEDELPALDTMDDADLLELHVKLTGSKPHHRANRDTIIKAIEAAEAQAALQGSVE